MGKKSTLIKIAFFSLLLVGMIVMQYSWIQGMQKDKMERFKSRVLSSINIVGSAMSQSPTLYELADTTFANFLGSSFKLEGLGKMQFEYDIDATDCQLASRGYKEMQAQTPQDLILHYTLRRTGESHRHVGVETVVIPFWKRIALKDMGWTIWVSILLTLTIAVIFYSVSFFGGTRRG